MNTVEKAGGVLLEFGNKLNGKIKILFCVAAIAAVFFFIFLLWCIYEALNSAGSSWAESLLPFVAAVLEYIIFWRYFKRVFRQESIFISADTFTVINTLLNKQQEKSYNIADITGFRYNGKAAKTDHPLKGGSYDYLGFETQELVIAEVHNEGNLSFVYSNKIIYFGRNVYSWDAEEINKVLSRVTGGQLQIGNLPEIISEEIPDNSATL